MLLKNEAKVRETTERSGWVTGVPIGCASSGGRRTLDHLQFNSIRLPLKVATVRCILSSLGTLSFQRQACFILYGQTQMFPCFQTNSLWANSTHMSENEGLSSQLPIMDHCVFSKANENTLHVDLMYVSELHVYIWQQNCRRNSKLKLTVSKFCSC